MYHTNLFSICQTRFCFSYGDYHSNRSNERPFFWPILTLALKWGFTVGIKFQLEIKFGKILNCTRFCNFQYNLRGVMRGWGIHGWYKPPSWLFYEEVLLPLSLQHPCLPASYIRFTAPAAAYFVCIRKHRIPEICQGEALNCSKINNPYLSSRYCLVKPKIYMHFACSTLDKKNAYKNWRKMPRSVRLAWHAVGEILMNLPAGLFVIRMNLYDITIQSSDLGRGNNELDD